MSDGCQKCNSKRVIGVMSHASDMHVITVNGVSFDGYLPSDLNLGGGDDLEMSICLDCGQVQGNWPLPESSVERKAQLVQES